jgi:hypothetical protein
MKTCKEFHPLIVAAARREPVAAELEQHLDTCPDCCVALANQRSLTAALGAIAKSDPLPPHAMQAALLAELRSVTPVRAARVSKRLAFLAAAIAAAVALAFFWPTPHTPAPPQLARVVPPPPVVEQPKPAPQPVRQLPVRAKRHQAPRTVPAAPAASVPQPEVATDFYRVPYTEPLRPNELADIYRVQVPRATMAAFGIPVIGGRLDSQITADVVVGEDGVTRAVRFIRQ